MSRMLSARVRIWPSREISTNSSATSRDNATVSPLSSASPRACSAARTESSAGEPCADSADPARQEMIARTRALFMWPPLTARTRVLPCHRQRLAYRACPRRWQRHIRGPGTAPRPFHRHEGLGLAAHEQLLLFRRELHHSPTA